jgi:ATP-dependent DNA helicase RecG
MELTTKVSQASRSLKLYAKRLERLGIATLGDFLYHIPSRYEDYSLLAPIGTLQEGEVVTVRGHVVQAKNQYTKRFKTLQKVTLADDTGSIDLTWFNQPFIVKNLGFNDTLSVSGRVELFSHKITMISPVYEVLAENTQPVHTGRIIPVYPETHGVSSKWLRRQIYQLLEELTPELEEYLPEELRRHYDLLDLPTAIRQIHYPASFEQAEKARARLGFDELFLLQLAAKQRKKQWMDQKKGHAFKLSPYQHQIDALLASLPFTLTPSQQEAVTDIFSDLRYDKPMNRLLQGDVGSGKTIIATSAIYLAYLNGFQSALMAPTEILAQQHFATIKKILEPFGVHVGLVTGGQKAKSLDLRTKNDIIVGTHALVAGKVNFDKLGLVVIDEQQRFGVEQRGILREKGESPHILTMTATPIPRTVALTAYGELAVSYLKEMPKGRKKIKTWLVPSEKRDGAYSWIRKEIRTNDSQAFIICPFIEESESMQTVKAATVEFERLQREVFPDLRLGLLHGKMKAKEKDAVLQAFRDKQYEILIATPVVEVGIDIPNATIIVIEGAERFGLAQLHQLRGRVGRGDKQSYCLLFTDSQSEQARIRLKAMETMDQGAELAEYDLKMRGPGDMYGLAQSGTRMLKIASFSDVALIEKAQKAAESLFPSLDDHPVLLATVNEITNRKVAPD